jgi:hypothetical protein
MERHYLASHMMARWPCKQAREFVWKKLFASVYNTKQPEGVHLPKCKWACQYDRYLGLNPN